MDKTEIHKLVLAKDLEKGSLLMKEYLTFKRPGTGMSPKLLNRGIGKRITRDLVEDTILTWDMLEVCPKLLGFDDGRSSEGVLNAIQSLVVKEEARHDN